jgi:hypothetical protein
MPNWCNNTITIKGSTETVKQLWEDANQEGSSRGLLNAMVPMPTGLVDTTKGTGDELQTEEHDGHTNWYDWSVNRWGTKWDVDTEGLEFTDNGDGTAEISGYFDSAWSPPIEAYQQFCEDMDGVFLEAYYEEGGMCFVGYWSSEGGDDYYEYSEFTSDNIRDNIPAYLVDEYALDERLAEYEAEEEEEEEVDLTPTGL